MRIAYVNNFFPPRVSGSAHQTEDIARRAAAAGHEVLVLTTGRRQDPADELLDGYRVVRFRSFTPPRSKVSFGSEVPWSLSPGNARRLFRVLDEFEPDVVHQHGQFLDLSWMSSAYVARRDVPTVMTVHTRLEHPNRLVDLLYRVGEKLLVQPFLSMARPWHVIMDRLFDEYVRDRYGVDDAHRIVIPLGVDPDVFHGVDGSAIRERHGLQSRPVVLSIGHVIPVRDRVTIVRAMPAVIDKFPDVCLLVVGEVMDDTFLEVARELGVTEANMICTGAVPRDEIPAYVGAADVEVHDTDGIGLGNASLEVMGAGLASVAGVRSDNFMHVDVRSWDNIVLVAPADPDALADALVRLLADPDLAARIGAGQRQLMIDHFTIDDVAAQHLSLYERVIAARR